jgi:hypothetical protein
MIKTKTRVAKKVELVEEREVTSRVQELARRETRRPRKVTLVSFRPVIF